MRAFSNRSSQRLAQTKTGNSQENIVIHTRLLMMSRHTCPCCSYILLRHLHSSSIYWRCSHCYQEMPAFQAIT